MKKTNNLFAQWKRGHWAQPKVYLVRINFTDKGGNARSCLKLGRTRQPLHKRIIRFLGEMKNATGFSIPHYDVISILYDSNSSGIEHALHSDLKHHTLYDEFGSEIKFNGSSEILDDTRENSEIIQYSDLTFANGEYRVPYYSRETNKPDSIAVSNVV